MMIATSVNPPSASVCAIVASTGVSTLKCDGTPRQAWSDTKNVSTTQAAVNKPSKKARERFLIGSNDAITVTLIKVKPNERPNVAGLRSDNGPSHVPPRVSSIARWMMPLNMSRPPVQYAARSMIFTSQVGRGVAKSAPAGELGSNRKLEVRTIVGDARFRPTTKVSHGNPSAGACIGRLATVLASFRFLSTADRWNRAGP